jgi:hypothetical protein
VAHEQHRDADDQRHLDGDTAHGRRGRSLPPEQPDRLTREVRTALFNLTTKGVVTSSSTTNNHLLFTNF